MLSQEIQRAIGKNAFDEFVDLVTPADAVAKYEGRTDLHGTFLHICAEKNRTDMAEHLIKLGADVDCRGGLWNATPMTYAADLGHLEVIKLLRKYGAKFDVADEPFINPLFAAISSGKIEVVKYLIDEGLDPHLVYSMSGGELYNALNCAQDEQQTEIIEYLKEVGCKEPIKGVDQPIWEKPREEWSEPMSDYDNVIEYMAERFGPVDELGLQEIVPVVEGMSVTINVIPPNEEHPFLVLFTNGMSDLPMTGHEDWQYAELVMHLPADWPHPRDVEPDSPSLWPVKLLRQLAYHPHLAGTCYMPPAAFVAEDPPEPFGDTNFTCAFMVPRFANLQVPLQRDGGRLVHFFTVIPLYTAERDYEVNNGLDAFFNKFIESKVPMTVDPERPSFA